MNNMKPFREFKKQALKDPEILREYGRLGPEFELARMLIQKRLCRKLTQAALAKKVGTQQAAIARLESGSYNPTIKQLERIAKALEVKLVIKMT